MYFKYITFFIREPWVQDDVINIFGLFSEKYLDCSILNVYIYPNFNFMLRYR